MSIEFQLARARSLHITFELWADNKCAINGSVSFCREANASLPYRGLVQYTLEPMHSNRLIECEALASGGSGGDGIVGVGVAVAAARDLIVWYITNGIKSECWMLRMWVQCGKCEKNMALRFVTCDTKSSISPLSVLEYRNCIRARKKNHPPSANAIERAHIGEQKNRKLIALLEIPASECRFSILSIVCVCVCVWSLRTVCKV